MKAFFALIAFKILLVFSFGQFFFNYCLEEDYIVLKFSIVNLDVQISPQISKLVFIISLNKLPTPFSLSSPFRTPVMHTLSYLMMAHD